MLKSLCAVLLATVAADKTYRMPMKKTPVSIEGRRAGVLHVRVYPHSLHG